MKNVVCRTVMFHSDCLSLGPHGSLHVTTPHEATLGSLFIWEPPATWTSTCLLRDIPDLFSDLAPTPPPQLFQHLLASAWCTSIFLVSHGNAIFLCNVLAYVHFSLICSIAFCWWLNDKLLNDRNICRSIESIGRPLLNVNSSWNNRNVSSEVMIVCSTFHEFRF